jgi:hypothetical protein
MKPQSKVEVGCRLAGEYLDEGQVPANLAQHRGEPVRPKLVADFLDLWCQGEDESPQNGTAEKR